MFVLVSSTKVVYLTIIIFLLSGCKQTLKSEMLHLLRQYRTSAADEQSRKEERRKQRAAAAAIREELLQSTCQKGFDCCILAAPSYHVIGMLTQLLPLLAPSACFVVFSNWQQPLAECHMWLQHSKLAVNLQLTESWCRDYQVLPARTHPKMAMSGTGGYLLSGIKIAVGQ